MRVFRSMFVVFLLHASTCGRYTVDLIPVNERKRNTLNLKKKKEERETFFLSSFISNCNPSRGPKCRTRNQRKRTRSNTYEKQKDFSNNRDVFDEHFFHQPLKTRAIVRHGMYRRYCGEAFVSKSLVPNGSVCDTVRHTEALSTVA